MTTPRPSANMNFFRIMTTHLKTETGFVAGAKHNNPGWKQIKNTVVQQWHKLSDAEKAHYSSNATTKYSIETVGPHHLHVKTDATSDGLLTAFSDPKLVQQISGSEDAVGTFLQNGNTFDIDINLVSDTRPTRHTDATVQKHNGVSNVSFRGASSLKDYIMRLKRGAISSYTHKRLMTAIITALMSSSVWFLGSYFIAHRSPITDMVVKQRTSEVVATAYSRLRYQPHRFVGRGFQGTVYSAVGNDKKVIKVTAIKNKKRLKGTLEEIAMAKLASQLGIGPKIYDVQFLNGQHVVHSTSDPITTINLTMERVNMVNAINTPLHTRDYISVSTIFKKLYSFSTSGNGFIPLDFNFGTTTNHRWVIVDYGVTERVTSKKEFMGILSDYLESYEDFLPSRILHASLQHYIAHNSDEFSMRLRDIM
jgi:hypothetical protein